MPKTARKPKAAKATKATTKATTKANATSRTTTPTPTPAVESPPATFRFKLVPDGDAGSSAKMRHLAERLADLAANEAGSEWAWCEIVLEQDGIGGLRTLLRVEGPRANELRADDRG